MAFPASTDTVSGLVDSLTSSQQTSLNGQLGHLQASQASVLSSASATYPCPSTAGALGDSTYANDASRLPQHRINGQ